MNKPDKNGDKLIDHLRQVERQTGQKPKDMELPEFPVSLANVWSAFIDLSNTRAYGMSGALPISYSEIKAWKELTETPLNSRMVSTIKRLDSIYLKVMNG